MILPFRTLKLYAHDFEIEEMDHHESNERQVWGQFVSSRFRIRVQTVGVPTRKTAQTLIHECLHAIWAFAALEKGDEEERIVTASAHGLAMVLRDNPVFARWLLEALA